MDFVFANRDVFERCHVITTINKNFNCCELRRKCETKNVTVTALEYEIIMIILIRQICTLTTLFEQLAKIKSSLSKEDSAFLINLSLESFLKSRPHLFAIFDYTKKEKIVFINFNKTTADEKIRDNILIFIFISMYHF